eukprot:scaffold36507_cov213-Isochrysis_galbana.AAC.1
MTTLSPSCRKQRVLPSGIGMGSVPRHDRSSIEPRESSDGPEMVPVARRSPGWSEQPPALWCAT